MLKEKNPLPGSQREASLVNWNHLAGPRERHPKMTWAVIGAFVSVNQKREIFGNEMIEERMEVSSRLGISIFHDDETRTGVTHKNG